MNTDAAAERTAWRMAVVMLRCKVRRPVGSLYVRSVVASLPLALAIPEKGQASCADLKDRGPRDAAPQLVLGTANRSCRRVGAVLPTHEVSRERPSRDLLTGEQPPPGGPNGGHSRLSLDRLSR
jgi:hypothetical protein